MGEHFANCLKMDFWAENFAICHTQPNTHFQCAGTKTGRSTVILKDMYCTQKSMLNVCIAVLLPLLPSKAFKSLYQMIMSTYGEKGGGGHLWLACMEKYLH